MGLFSCTNQEAAGRDRLSVFGQRFGLQLLDHGMDGQKIPRGCASDSLHLLITSGGAPNNCCRYAAPFRKHRVHLLPGPLFPVSII